MKIKYFESCFMYRGGGSLSLSFTGEDNSSYEFHLPIDHYDWENHERTYKPPVLYADHVNSGNIVSELSWQDGLDLIKPFRLDTSWHQALFEAKEYIENPLHRVMGPNPYDSIQHFAMLVQALESKGLPVKIGRPDFSFDNFELTRIEDLSFVINRIDWFSQLGKPMEEIDAVFIPDLEILNEESGLANSSSVEREELRTTVMDMNWLPVNIHKPHSLGEEWLPAESDTSDPLVEIRFPLSPDHPHPFGRGLPEITDPVQIKHRQIAGAARWLCEGVGRIVRRQIINIQLETESMIFLQTARSSAMCAVYFMAIELLLDKKEPWCNLFKYCLAGHWPLGILKDGRIVVL
ncbi:MAG: hypothetical protein R3C11_12005 [Planctomycetaceae bacterium]